MALRAVVFDVGGTLLDMSSDDEAHRRAFAWAADAWSLPVDGEALWREHMAYMAPYWRGQPDAWRPLRDLTRTSFHTLLERHGRRPTEEAWGRFWRHYLDAHRAVLRPYPDAEECLTRVARLGVHVGILSDVDIDFLDLILEVTAFRDRFDAITTSEEVGVGKPNPRTFHLALQKAGCRPSEAAYVGDSSTRDVRGARSVGMRTIHVVRTELPDEQADAVARNLREAADALESWSR